MKKVKTVPPSKKKIYMLFHLEPDESLTGGAWYSDQEFETEFVDVLNVKCQQYLQKKVNVRMKMCLSRIRVSHKACSVT